MTVHSKGHILTAALKAIQWIRAQHLLQWHAEIGQGNICSKEKKFFKIEQYNHQNKIYAQTSREMKENILWVQGGHHPSDIEVWWEVSNQGVQIIFAWKG